MEDKIPFGCPLCGRNTDRPVGELKEGAVITCPFCRVTINLHGCMWENLKKEIEALSRKS